MPGTAFERLSAATGYVALVCGAAAVALERPWPSMADPNALPAFVADNRAAILAQSMLFLLSAGLMMWFLGSLRTIWFSTSQGPAGSVRSPSAPA